MAGIRLIGYLTVRAARLTLNREKHIMYDTLYDSHLLDTLVRMEAGVRVPTITLDKTRWPHECVHNTCQFLGQFAVSDLWYCPATEYVIRVREDNTGFNMPLSRYVGSMGDAPSSLLLASRLVLTRQAQVLDDRASVNPVVRAEQAGIDLGTL